MSRSMPPAPFARRVWVGLAVALAGAVIGLGAAAAPLARALDGQEATFQKLSLFAEALRHIEANYVLPVRPEQLIYGAIGGMVATLDPHSEFLDPAQYREFLSDSEGRFAGIGVEIAVRDGWLTVLSVFRGGPAERAGLRPGDRFVTLDGRPARDMRIADAVRLMRGEPGTTVHVQVRREDAEHTLGVTLTRAYIDTPSVEARVLPGGVIYLRIQRFQSTTADEVRVALDRALGAMHRAGAERGVLLDLRDDGGGLLQQAVRVADAFLRAGEIVSTRGRAGEPLERWEAHARGTRPAWPMVALINGYTASAAEILAGALQDHRRATLVGTRSFGKGSVQRLIELSDGSALKLTTATYFTPSGRSIQARGIEPDIRVDGGPEHASAGSPAAQTGVPAPPKLRAEPDGDTAAPREQEAALPRHLPGAGERPAPREIVTRSAQAACRSAYRSLRGD